MAGVSRQQELEVAGHTVATIQEKTALILSCFLLCTVYSQSLENGTVYSEDEGRLPH